MARLIGVLRFLPTLALTSALLFSLSTVHAASYTWQDGVFGDWNDASRWIGGPAGTVPGASDTATINSGQVQLANNVTVGTLNWGGGGIGDKSDNTGTIILTVATALNINGSTQKNLALSSQSGSFGMDNKGVAVWTGSSIGTSQFSGATGSTRFLNFGSFNIQNDAFFSVEFDNFTSATVTKQSGTGISTFSRPFNNLNDVKVQSGTLRLSSGGIVGNASSYDCTAAGTLILSGTFENISGTPTFSGPGHTQLDVSGTIPISGGATINITGNFEQFGTIRGAGAVKVTGTLDWFSGSMRNTNGTSIEAAGKLNIKGHVSIDGGLINNNGTTTWSDGTPSVSNGGTFNNKSGGKFNIQLTTDRSFGTSNFDNPAFNNEVGGTVTKTGTFKATFGIPYNNKGTTTVQGGTLLIEAGGTSSGNFNTSTGAQTFFSTQTSNVQGYTHSNGTSFTGAGTVTNQGSVNVAAGATVNCSSNYVLIDFGILKVNLSGIFNVQNTFTLNDGILDGSGALNVAGKLIWLDGTMKGTGGETNILTGGQMEINNVGSSSDIPNHSLETRTLNNSGTITLQGNGNFGDSVSMTNGAIIKNRNGGVLNIKRNGIFADNGTGERFDNETGAIINCDTLALDFLASATLNVPFNNDGTVNVQKGAFVLFSGGTGVGAFKVAAGAILDIDFTTYIANSGTTFSGAGVTVIEGSGLTIPTGTTITIPLGHTMRLAGVIDGGGSLVINGTLDWQSGLMLGGGTTTIANGATATFTGSSSSRHELSSRTFNNNGAITWSTGELLLSKSTFNNNTGGTFITQTDGFLSQGSTPSAFNNNTGATFTRSGNSSTLTCNVPFVNQGTVNLQSGTLEFQIFNNNYKQTAGVTNLNGGNISAKLFNGNLGDIDIQGGILFGNGTINANLINSALVKPGQSPGTISVSGNYTQTATGKLEIEIAGTAAGTQYDRFLVTGTATLDGDLAIVRLNNFSPSLSDTFEIVTYASRTGAFAISGVEFGNGQLLSPIYNSTNLTLASRQRKMTIEDVTVTEGTGGTTTTTFTVSLSDASGQSVTVTYATSNGSATAPADYTAIAQSTLTFNPGQTTQTISVTVQSDSVDEDDETFFVNLTAPVSAILENNQAEGTILDDDAAPTLSIADRTIPEGNSGGFVSTSFTVTLSAASSKTVKVNYTTVDVTAIAGADYTAVSGTLTFAPGETSKTIGVPIKGDVLDEPNELFRINLSTPINATLADTQATGTITDDDKPPVASISSVTVTEGNSGTVNATFIVTLSAPSGQTVTVNTIPSNGTARSPGDYTAGGVKLVYAPGETSKLFNVPVKGDLLDEPNETFFVILSAPVNATIGVGRGTGNITDDDATPSITVDNVNIGEGNAGQRVAAFRLKLSAASGQVVKVKFATANGTAIAGAVPGDPAANDYTAVAPTDVAFTVGNVFAFARVLINGDVLNEPDQNFLVNLSAPVNATIADNQAVGTILNDDTAPALTINDVQISEGNLVNGQPGTKDMTFTVTLSKPSGQTVKVNYATANGTAQAGNDYTTTVGTLTFAPGSALTQTVTVAIKGDAVVEGNETLFILLSSPVNASVGRGRGVGTINNDDAVTAITPDDSSG